MTKLSLQHRLICLRLNQVEKFGGAKLMKLSQHLPLASLADATTAELQQLGFTPTQAQQFIQPDWQLIDQQLAWSEKPDQHLVSFTCGDYPTLLKEISSPPILLFVKGQLDALHQPQIAMVGSRNPTPVGKENAMAFATELVKQQIVVTSGLALGIDGCCHQAAVNQQQPTVAVLGTGVDNIYPKRHKSLAESIVGQGGAIISEFPLGTPARPDHFPRRNRIISGLSLGTLVVEATIRSGSLITARCALEQNREVFAIPGSIHNIQAKGCHYLIRQGAVLVEQVEHLLEEIAIFNHKPINDLNQPLKKAETKCLAGDQLLDSVGYEPTSVDSIASRSRLSVEQVLQQLLELELQGLVSAVSGGYIRMRGN